MTTTSNESTRVASWRLLLRNPVTVVSAVVHTWGADAVDVLYVQDPQNRPLSPTVAADLVAGIEAALSPGAPG